MKPKNSPCASIYIPIKNKTEQSKNNGRIRVVIIVQKTPTNHKKKHYKKYMHFISLSKIL